MPDILIQFHALPSELLPFAQKCVEDFNLHVTAFRFFPFKAMAVPIGELPERLSDSSPWKEFAFTITPPVLPATAAGKFADSNPERMRLAIGDLSDKGLRQSSLSARTSNLEALKTWRSIAKRLKDITKTGVVVVNPDTGATVRARTFRYSAGVKTLELQGVRILPVAGGNIFKLGEIIEG